MTLHIKQRRHRVDRHGRTSRPGQALLVFVALFALAAKVTIARNTYGTNDALTFEADIATLKGAGPRELYLHGVRPGRIAQPFSHSPAVIHGLMLLGRLESQSGFPVRFWIRLFCAFADLVSLVLLWKMGVRSLPALMLVALAPVAMMISGFHVNFDPLVTCAVLAAACMIRSRRFVWAGAALGIALSIKLLALVFVPVLAIAAAARKTAVVAGVAILCFWTLSLPFIREFPEVIAASMLRYQGSYKFWGIPGISLLIFGSNGYLWYRAPGRFIAFGAVVGAAVILRRKGRGEDILRNCGLSAALFLLLTPGFGVQYLAYLIPWLVAGREYARVALLVVSGAFLGAFYTWGSGGIPWYFADYFVTRPMPAHVFALALLTWLLVGILAADFAGSEPTLRTRSPE